MSAPGQALCSGPWARKEQTSDQTACLQVAYKSLFCFSASQTLHGCMILCQLQCECILFQIPEECIRLQDANKAGSQERIFLSFVLLELHHPAVMLNGIVVQTVNADIFMSQLPNSSVFAISCKLIEALSHSIFEGS